MATWTWTWTLSNISALIADTWGYTQTNRSENMLVNAGCKRPADLTFPSAEDHPSKAVSRFIPIQLNEDAPTIGLVFQVSKWINDLGHTSNLTNSPRQRRRSAAKMQRAE